MAAKGKVPKDTNERAARTVGTVAERTEQDNATEELPVLRFFLTREACTTRGVPVTHRQLADQAPQR